MRPDSQVAHRERLKMYRKQQVLLRTANDGAQMKRKHDEDGDRGRPEYRSIRRRLDSQPSCPQPQTSRPSHTVEAFDRKKEMPRQLDDFKGRLLGIEDELIDTITWVANQCRSHEKSDFTDRDERTEQWPGPRHQRVHSPTTSCYHDSALSCGTSGPETASPSSCSERGVAHVSLANIEEPQSPIAQEASCDEVIAVEMPGSMLQFSTRGFGDWGALQSAVLDIMGF